PASVSKYHPLALCTSGMGAGQFLAPIYRIVVPSGSLTRRCISKYLCTKSARVCMSSVTSPDEMICFPSGPRSSSKAFSLLLCMAATKVLLASSGDENVLCPGCCARVLAGKHPASKIASAAYSRTVAEYHVSMLRIVRCMGHLSNSKFHRPGARRYTIIGAHHRLEVHRRHRSSRFRVRRSL